MSKEVGGMVGSRRVQGAGSARTEGARRASGVGADGAAVGAGASRRPPGSRRPRPRDHVHLHGLWHASHLSNLPRPYTK